MKKALKIILTTICVIIILVVALPIVLSMLLQIDAIQNFAVRKVTSTLSEKAQTKISISHIELKFFTKLAIQDAYMEDYRGDTLIYVKNLDVDIKGINFFTGAVSLRSVDIINGQCNLFKDSTGSMNIQQVFAKFKSANPSQSSLDLRLDAGLVNLTDFHFTLKNYDAPLKKYGVNFKDIDLTKFNFLARNVSILNYDIKLAIENLSLQEKSGFNLYKMSSSSCSVNENGMRFVDVFFKDANTTLACRHINLLYDTWYAYNDFVNKVTLDVDLKPSIVSLRTLSYFIGQSDDMTTALTLSGHIRGPIPNLHGFFSDISIRNTRMSTSFSIIGLPDINKAAFSVSLENLVTSAKDINAIYSEITKKELKGIGHILERNGTIRVNGSFKGMLSNFNTTADITTSLGNVHASLNLTPQKNGTINMIGTFGSTGYNLGTMLANKELGMVIFQGDVDANILNNGSISVDTKTDVSSFYFAGYDYKNINFTGKLEGKTYEGTITSQDPNCDFVTTGRFDLSDTIPKFNFSMNLSKANFAALGFNKRDSVSTLTARFSAAGTASGLEDFNGDALIDSITYINHIDTVRTSEIKIISHCIDSIKTIKLSSDFADIDFSGTNSYSEILRYIRQAVSKYVPSIPEAEQMVTGLKALHRKTLPQKEYTQGSYTIDVNVKKANNVASIFLPGFEIASGTTLQFQLDPKQDKLRLNLESECLGTKTENLRKISLRGFNRGDSILFRMAAYSCEAAGVYMPNLSIRGNVRNNTVTVRAEFENPVDGSMAQIRAVTSVYRTPENLPQIKVTLGESAFAFNHQRWEISPSYAIFDTTGIQINHLRIEHEQQFLAVNGKIGRNINDSLLVNLKDFDISPASKLVEKMGYNITGKVSGRATSFATLGDMIMDANLKLDSVRVNGYLLANTTMTSEWDHLEKTINIKITDDKGYIPISGSYNIPKGTYRATINLPKLDMVLIEPLLKGILRETSGEASADLTLSGGKGTPSLDGIINIKKYDFKVDYTKARYSLSGMVEVEKSCFKATKLPLTDGLVGKGVVTANLDTYYFKNLRYGVNIDFHNLLALNTTIKDNAIFYGQAFGIGNFKITGSEYATKMDITAETALESELFLPFTGVASIDEANFITFVDKNIATKDTLPQHRALFEKKQSSTTSRANDMNININLSVTKNTKAHISMVSEYMGNQISGVGTGKFQMHINPSQDLFTMNGTYDISKGSYKFNFAGFFDKQFAITSGGQVFWTGDPADPEVNINAVYKVKASLPTAETSNGSSGYAQKVHLDCGINLSGKLFSPIMRLSISAPSADPETQNVLRNMLNTEEAISNQFFSLFLYGGFASDMGSSSMGSMGGSLFGATGFEFLSNQVSNLLSTEKVNIRLNYRPRSEMTSDEFNAGLETDIVPNKLVLEIGGNYSTNNNPVYTQRSPFSADAYLTWIMNQGGTLNLKGFTRVIERFDETQGLQETGMGIYFRQDFQTVAELRQRWRDWIEQKRKKRQDKKDNQGNDTSKPDVDSTENMPLKF